MDDSQIRGLSFKVSGLKEQSNTKYSESYEQEDIVPIEEVKVGGGDEGEDKEWISEPDPGVLITLVQLPHGGNLLKKIYFSEELFDSWQAESWWRENEEKIVDLYSISQISSSQNQYPSDQENQIDEAEESAEISGQRNSWYRCLGSRDDGSVGISETERGGEAAAAEWVVEDEPGVFVILRSLPDGSPVFDRVELK
ncbi:protein Brevis radix-like 1 [Carex rostrata]